MRAFGLWSDLIGITTLIGETILRTGAAVRGRARTRIVDLLAYLEDAGIAALPMVALVNLLVGGIVAFVAILEPHSGAVLTEGRGNFVATPVRGGNPIDGAVVAGMADAVNQLADSIASAVKGLPPLLGVSSPTIRAIERWQLPG
jgi:hypothetical protein